MESSQKRVVLVIWIAVVLIWSNLGIDLWRHSSGTPTGVVDVAFTIATAAFTWIAAIYSWRVRCSPDSVPELAAFSEDRRKQIWRECVWARRMPRWFWPVALLGLPVAFLAVIGCAHLGIATPVLLTVFLVLVTGVWPVLFGVLWMRLHIGRALLEIRKRVAGLCPNCGCDLRATPDRCPESGTGPPK